MVWILSWIWYLEGEQKKHFICKTPRRHQLLLCLIISSLHINRTFFSIQSTFISIGGFEGMRLREKGQWMWRHPSGVCVRMVLVFGKPGMAPILGLQRSSVCCWPGPSLSPGLNLPICTERVWDQWFLRPQSSQENWNSRELGVRWPVLLLVDLGGPPETWSPMSGQDHNTRKSLGFEKQMDLGSNPSWIALSMSPTLLNSSPVKGSNGAH